MCESVGEIVCFGGFGLVSNPTDMWSSTDGATWTGLATPPWNATDPADIGLNSEQFAALENHMTALDAYVDVHADFFSELDACGMDTNGMLGACEYEVLDAYETALVDTTLPVNDTWDAFGATLEP